MLGWGDAFPGSRQFPSHPILPHGIPGPAVGLMLCVTPKQLGGKLRSACDPCPLSARTEPPGRLRSSTGSPYELHPTQFLELSASVGLIRIAPGPFRSQVEPSWERAQALGLNTAPVRPHGSLDIRMSLSTLVYSPT